jgi:hypothetical protein
MSHTDQNVPIASGLTSAGRVNPVVRNRQHTTRPTARTTTNSTTAVSMARNTRAPPMHTGTVPVSAVIPTETDHYDQKNDRSHQQERTVHVGSVDSIILSLEL